MPGRWHHLANQWRRAIEQPFKVIRAQVELELSISNNNGNHLNGGRETPGATHYLVHSHPI